MAKKKIEISFESAVKVSDRVEFQSVKLLSCVCMQKKKCPVGPKAFDITKTSRYEINDEHNVIGVIVQFGLHAYGKGVEQKKKNSFFDIDATFILSYSISSCDGLNDIEFNNFAQLNGIYNAWPYWREFVQSITSRMGLPTLTVPVFRFVKSPSKIGTEQKAAPLKN